MTDNNDIVPITNEYKNIQEMALDVEDTEIIMKSNCKLCNSEHRADAEACFDKTNNYTAVANLLAQRGEKIAPKNIKNHLVEHYIEQEKRLRVRDYAIHLKDYMKVKNNTSETIAMCRAMIWKELMEIGSEAGGLSSFERRKNSELMIKLTAQMMALVDQERKVNGELHLVHVIIERLTQIVEAEQEHAPPEFKTRLNKVVTTLLDNIEGMEGVK